MADFGSATENRQPTDLSAGRELDQAVELILRKANLLTQTQLNELLLILTPFVHSKQTRPLTLFEQMFHQRKILQQLSENMFDANGNLRKSTTEAKDVKDTVSTIAQMTKLVADIEGQIYTAERARRMESVVVQTIKNSPAEVQEKFFTLLQSNMIDQNSLPHTEELFHG